MVVLLFKQKTAYDMRMSVWSSDVLLFRSAELPLVIHVGGEFYFKGESVGRVWLSPHDETPTGAHDAAPDEMDVAIAIERMQSVVDWPVAAVERKWAGLRSFAPDRIPVFGPDREEGRFVWCARSEERREGKECVSTCRSRGAP